MRIRKLIVRSRPLRITVNSQIAEELRLPVLVIVDMERASKAEEITHFSQMYPTFMRFQWVEYTGMRRREALEEITTFLTEQTLKGGDDETNSQVSTDDIADSHVYHHGINTLMAWGGLDLVPKHKRSTISTTLSAWYVSVKFSTYVCLGVCITRLIYAHGPAFTDYNSALATVAVHLHLIWAPIVIRSIMLSVRVRKVLSEVLKGADVASIYFISKWLFYAGALLVPVALLLYVLAWEPLFFSMMYIGPQASMFEKVFGIGSGVLFLMGIFTHIPLLVCVHIMSIIIKLMSCVALTVIRHLTRHLHQPAAPWRVARASLLFVLTWMRRLCHRAQSATDKLHPQLANLGLERYILLRRRMFKFKDAAKTNTPYTAVSTLADTNPEEAQVAAGSVPPLSLTDVSIAAFQEHWQTGWRIYVSLNSNLWPMHNIQLLWTVIGLSVPSSLAIISHLNPDFQIDIPETPLYIYVLNCLRVVWIWAQGPVFLLIEVAAEAFITYARCPRPWHDSDLSVCRQLTHHPLALPTVSGSRSERRRHISTSSCTRRRRIMKLSTTSPRSLPPPASVACGSRATFAPSWPRSSSSSPRPFRGSSCVSARIATALSSRAAMTRYRRRACR